MNKIMIILLHSMQFRRMEEWRISDWGTGKNLEGIRPATWRGTNKRILWTRLGRVWFQSKLFSLLNQEESIIVAKLKRNTPFHACMRIYTCVCVCVYVYTRVPWRIANLLTRPPHCRGWLESPWCSSPPLIYLRSPYQPLGCFETVCFAYGIYKMEDNANTRSSSLIVFLWISVGETESWLIVCFHFGKCQWSIRFWIINEDGSKI